MSQTLTENLSAEGFYQLDWEKTVTDNCGTFFSQADVITGGCNDNLRLLSNSVITRRWFAADESVWRQTSTKKVCWLSAA